MAGAGKLHAVIVISGGTKEDAAKAVEAALKATQRTKERFVTQVKVTTFS